MGDAQLQHDARTLKKEEAALRYYMKEHALRMCPAEQKGYADCVRGRTLSVVSLHSRPHIPNDSGHSQGPTQGEPRAM